MERPCQISSLVVTGSLVLRPFLLFVLVGAYEHAASVVAESAIATVDHSDIRGSEPHSGDPSGAASD